MCVRPTRLAWHRQHKFLRRPEGGSLTGRKIDMLVGKGQKCPTESKEVDYHHVAHISDLGKLGKHRFEDTRLIRQSRAPMNDAPELTPRISNRAERSHLAFGDRNTVDREFNLTLARYLRVSRYRSMEIP